MASSSSSFFRDFLVLVVVLGIVLGGLFAFAGTWPPAVIVESGSMMHRDDDVTYGRVGTIDPGDMVLVKRVDRADEVTTLLEGGRERYGKPGDVVVFHANGNEDATPIIHRAIAWVSVGEVRGRTFYEVKWDPDAACPAGAARPRPDRCVWGAEGITIPGIVDAYRPARGGLITKGDNPTTNARADQTSGLSTIVQADWIQGKARGEMPWLGLIKLAVAPQPNEDSPPPTWVRVGNAFAPKDLWVMLSAALVGLVGAPVAFDAFRALARRPSDGRAR